MEGILAAEKSKWADERASMIKALESAMEESSKQRIEIANKELRDLDPSFKQLAEAGWSLPKVRHILNVLPEFSRTSFSL